ncbi:hypothetical protein AB8Z38_06790 [Bradyrhizobium sp. LLZ17]|uniref:Terminase small subunit protein n=1 Tax=Bradyrhizobium sp. LLZ17 TaxID=3239388 RepID=A0AB39XNV6_9BRAD
MQVAPESASPKTTGPYVEFTEEIFAEICERMANGEGLRKICSDRDMPSRSTFLRWVENDTGRQSKYQKAREALMDWYSEEILAIAWDDSKDTIKREGKDDLCNHEWIARSRLKVDTLKFLMAKLHPKRYGDKLPEAVEDRNIKISWENERSAPFNKDRVGWRPCRRQRRRTDEDDRRPDADHRTGHNRSHPRRRRPRYQRQRFASTPQAHHRAGAAPRNASGARAAPQALGI